MINCPTVDSSTQWNSNNSLQSASRTLYCSVWQRVALIIITTALLNACAVMSPEIHDSKLFDARYGRQPAVTSGHHQQGAVPAKFYGDLPDAIDDADSQSTAYSKAASQYSQFRNGTALGAGVTGIAAVLLGAMNHGSQNLRIGLSGASAAMLGLWGYYDNRPRQQVYLAGVTAITCAVEAVRPLLQTEEQHDKMAADESALRRALATFQTDLRSGAARGPGAKLTLDDATTAEDAAVSVLKTATAFDLAYDSVGVELREKVREIVVAVDAQVVKTDPDPAAMSKVIGGFSPSIPKLGTSAVSGAAAGQLKGQGAPDWFDADVNGLKTSTELLRLDIDARTKPVDVDKTLSTCKVADVAGKLKVSPAETAHAVAKVPTSLVYVISSGTLPLTVGLTGEYTAGAFTYNYADSTVTVSITKDAVGQKSTLTIADASGATPVTVDISVNANATVAAAAPPPVDKTKKPTPDKSKGATGALTTPEVTMIRSVVGATGEPASNTLTSADLDKLRVFASAGHVTLDAGTPDQINTSTPVYSAVVARARKTAETVAVDADEQKLVEQNQVATLRSVCKLPVAVPPAPALDAALRDKIFDFQLGSQQGVAALLAIDGKLDQNTLNAMLKAQCLAATK